MNKSDGSYRLLFSNPYLVRDLFQGIIDEPWVSEFDWSRLAPLPSDYISDSLRQRQSDLVWYLPRDDGDTIFFLLMLEHNRGIDDVQNLMQTTWNRTEGTEYTELRTAFTVWAKHVLLPRALPDVALPSVDDLLEIKTMLTEHSRSWTHQWKAEGLKEGASVILRKQLQRKFGTLPPEIQQRLKNATPAQLETWSLNVLDADTLDKVFDE